MSFIGWKFSGAVGQGEGGCSEDGFRDVELDIISVEVEQETMTTDDLIERKLVEDPQERIEH